MKRIFSALASLGAIFIVTACTGGSGGGGGGPPLPTASVQINASNAALVAKSTVDALGAFSRVSSTGNALRSAATQPASLSKSVLDYSVAKFAQLRAIQLPASGVMGAVFTETQPCAVSGTEAISVQDANNNNILDAGDSVTLNLAMCNDGSFTTNGSMTFAITALSGTTTVTASFGLTFSQFSSTDNATGVTDALDGDIGFAITDDGTTVAGTMSGSSLNVSNSVDGAFLITGYNIIFSESATSYSYSYKATIASTLMGGSVNVATTAPFTGTGTSSPTSGVMIITGANASTLTLTARPDGVHVGLTVDDDGAAGPDAPQILGDTTWTQL